MEKLISEETYWDLVKLGLYQIGGGAVGILLILWGIYNSPLPIGLNLVLYLFILLFFGYSIFCGILCLETKENALRHSLTNQILQVIGFVLMGFAFQYVAGFYLIVWFEFTESMKYGFHLGISNFKFNFNFLKEGDRIEVSFNLVAFALIFWIDRLMEKVEKEAAIRRSASIGDT